MPPRRRGACPGARVELLSVWRGLAAACRRPSCRRPTGAECSAVQGPMHVRIDAIICLHACGHTVVWGVLHCCQKARHYGTARQGKAFIALKRGRS